MKSHTRSLVICESWWSVCGCLGMLGVLLSVFALCVNFVQSTLYTLCVGTLSVLILVLCVYGLARERKYNVVFEGATATAHTHTNASSRVAYRDVESIRFSYSIGSDGMSPHIIALRTKEEVPHNVAVMNGTKGFWNEPPNSILWDVTGFSMGTVGRVLIELCERTSLSSIVVHFPQNFPEAPDSRLSRVLKRRGSLERDEASQDFIFKPFRNPVC